ncbi:MAG TPA: hypothetical protein VGI19_12550 [Candidatus Cybelea sp.]|jgi:hypothetical protein
MNFSRFTGQLLAGAVSAALLAGCNGGSQFAPPTGSAASAPATLGEAGAKHAGVSPGWVMYTGCALHNGQLQWYWINPRNYVWYWLKTSHITKGDSTLGGSATQATALAVATTDDTVVIYSGKKPVTTLTGLNGAASGVGMDSRGDTFAAVNVGSEATIDEFAQGATTPTATYADPNLTSVASLGIDRMNRVYVEGQSQTGTIEVDEMAGSGSFEPLAQAGALGATAGGLAVQSSGKTTYLYVNDLGNASEPANIARYEFTGKSLIKQGSFEYSGTNGAIAADPSGKDTKHVYAINNVPAGSQYSVSGIEYAFPSGQIVVQSSAYAASEESHGIWVK